MKQILTTLFISLFLVGCQTCPKKDCGNTNIAKKQPSHNTNQENKVEQPTAQGNFSLSLETIDGSTFSFENIKGNKHLFVTFWATWCEPCKTELFRLEEMYGNYEDKIEIVAVAIDTEESIDKVQAYAVENAFSFPVLIDPSNNTVSKMIPGGDTVPYSILVHKNGTVIKTHTGYEPGEEENIKRDFDQLINQ